MQTTESCSRALVTGGAGFIGSHLVDHLLQKGFDVMVIDNLYKGQMQNLAQNKANKRFHFVKGDIRDQGIIKKTMKDVDVVFHEAGLVGIPLSIKEPVLTNEANVAGTVNLLEVSSDLHVKRFVYASSAAVYGEVGSNEKKEDMITKPTSPYGVSKLAAENYVQSFHATYGLETVSLRYFNVYGPRQAFDLQNQYGGVITVFLNRLLQNLPLIICGDGEQTRDFVYVKDVVKANMLAMTCKEAVGDFFNVGSGLGISINRLAEVLKEAVDKRKIENSYVDPRPGDVRHINANMSKARKLLKFAPDYSLEEGIREMVEWYVKKRRITR